MKIPNFLICEFDVGMHNDQQTSKLSWGLQGPTERSLIPEHVPGRFPYFCWIQCSLLRGHTQTMWTARGEGGS